MADTSLFLIVAGMTVLLVMSLCAVMAISPEEAVRSEPPVLTPLLPPPAVPTRQPEAIAPPAAGQPTDTGDPAWHGEARVVTPHGTYWPEASSGPPWGPAPKPPGLL